MIATTIACGVPVMTAAAVDPASSCHWRSGVGVPLAAPVKVAVLPTVADLFVGCAVIAGMVMDQQMALPSPSRWELQSSAGRRLTFVRASIGCADQLSAWNVSFSASSCSAAVLSAFRFASFSTFEIAPAGSGNAGVLLARVTRTMAMLYTGSAISTFQLGKFIVFDPFAVSAWLVVVVT